MLADAEMRLEILRQAQARGLHEDHAFFIASTNPYNQPDCSQFESLLEQNSTSSILDAIFILTPTFKLYSELSTFVRRKRSETLTSGHESRVRRNSQQPLVPEVNFIYDAIILVDTILSENIDGDLQNVFQFSPDTTFHLFSGDITIGTDDRVIFDFALFDVNSQLSDATKVFDIHHLTNGEWHVIQSNEVSYPLSW